MGCFPFSLHLRGHVKKNKKKRKEEEEEELDSYTIKNIPSFKSVFNIIYRKIKNKNTSQTKKHVGSIAKLDGTSVLQVATTSPSPLNPLYLSKRTMKQSKN